MIHCICDLYYVVVCLSCLEMERLREEEQQQQKVCHSVHVLSIVVKLSTCYFPISVIVLYMK